MSYNRGLPKSIATKIYKTGQTRGADKDTIFQNRVLRNSTALIPLPFWRNGAVIPSEGFEKGYVVLARPDEYFSASPPIPRDELPNNLELGQNLLVFYETRTDWNRYDPDAFGWQAASSRQAPLGGQYVARVPDTTRAADIEIRHGFTNNATGGQGAGIRVFEYSSSSELEKTRFQLAFLAWRTQGIFELARAAASLGAIDEEEAAPVRSRRQARPPSPEESKAYIDQKCAELGLSDLQRLKEIRIINENEETVCPLCKKTITAIELASRADQAEGRGVPDLTITSANLFHIKEVRVGAYNHCTYNLGWGHYHCNTVARDWGVQKTLEWMFEVVRMNELIP